MLTRKDSDEDCIQRFRHLLKRLLTPFGHLAGYYGLRKNVAITYVIEYHEEIDTFIAKK